jgi:predicted lactoylglutathione lyase
MIGYVCIGTNDLAKSGHFYDALLATIGGKRNWETERFIAWHNSPTSPMLLMIKPLNGEPATPGNGTMVALAVDSKAKVDALHQKALELGGKDEGAPGPRGENFYASYFRDTEGNKLAAFFMG